MGIIVSIIVFLLFNFIPFRITFQYEKVILYGIVFIFTIIFFFTFRENFNRKREEENENLPSFMKILLLAILFSLFPALFLTLSQKSKRTKVLQNEGEIIYAQVLDVHTKNKVRISKSIPIPREEKEVFLTFKFNIGDVKYSYIENIDRYVYEFNKVEEGDSVKVNYLPENPSIHEVVFY